MVKLADIVEREVEEQRADGVPIDITLGSRHWHVNVGGKLATILPRAPRTEKNARADMNVRAHIRRAAAAWKRSQMEV